MFAFLTGRVLSVGDNNLVLDVNGVGYLLAVPKSVLANYQRGQGASFFIETVVREDAIQLYGFENEEQKESFNLLTTVQGVGNKTAMGFLDTLSPRAIALAILSGDSARLTAVPGVGPKLAGRIIQELKDKMMKQQGGAGPVADLGDGAMAAEAGDDLLADALAALQKLGFPRSEAYPVVARLLQSDDHKNKGVGDILPLALGLLAGR